MPENPHILETVSETLAQDPRWQVVQRVLASSQFKGSNRLRDFLLYVTECAIRDAPQEATEQQIGICVFQRSPGYNSSEDSIVRTHARLLRQKLATYFAEAGTSEELIIEIPKGQYFPVFRAAAIAPTPPHTQPVVTVVQPAPTALLSEEKKPGRKIHPGLLALLAGIILFVWWRWPKAPQSSSELDRLWQPFLTNEQPFVIYSNALFEGNSHTGLRVISSDTNQPIPPQDRFVESYTGVGEVVAIHEITELFAAHHASFVLKRSRLVSWDEAKSKNLIFVGAPSQNPALKVLPATTDFTIVSNGDYGGIANLHPKRGEPALYARPEHPLTKDYAIVALLPGAETGKWMLVLSGLTTFGTQAAAEFVCGDHTAAALVHAATQADRTLHPFEGVLEVPISNDVPLPAKLVSVHVK